MGLPMGRITEGADRREPDWAALSANLRDMARALVGPRGEEAAEELAQRAVVRLMVKAPGRAAHLGYARSTLVRLWLDEQRSTRRRLARLAVLARSPARSRNDHDHLDQSERLAHLRRRIDRLPPTQRAVLVMRLVGEMTASDIARALDLTEPAVRSALHAARARLRAELEQEP